MTTDITARPAAPLARPSRVLMPLAEWRRIAALIDNLWKDTFDEGREASYYTALYGYPTRAVEGAVIDLAAGAVRGRDPSDFGPSASHIAHRARTRDRLGEPPWATQQLRLAAARDMRGGYRASPSPTAMDWLAERHPCYGPALAQLADRVPYVLQGMLGEQRAHHAWQQFALRGAFDHIVRQAWQRPADEGPIAPYLDADTRCLDWTEAEDGR